MTENSPEAFRFFGEELRVIGEALHWHVEELRKGFDLLGRPVDFMGMRDEELG